MSGQREDHTAPHLLRERQRDRRRGGKRHRSKEMKHGKTEKVKFWWKTTSAWFCVKERSVFFTKLHFHVVTVKVWEAEREQTSHHFDDFKIIQNGIKWIDWLITCICHPAGGYHSYMLLWLLSSHVGQWLPAGVEVMFLLSLSAVQRCFLWRLRKSGQDAVVTVTQLEKSEGSSSCFYRPIMLSHIFHGAHFVEWCNSMLDTRDRKNVLNVVQKI